jgi:hypothetical protein
LAQVKALARDDEKHCWAEEQTGALAVLMVLLELEAEGWLWAGELAARQGQLESRLPKLEQAHHPQAQIPFDFHQKLEEGLDVPLGLISCKFRVRIRRVVIPVAGA